MGKLIEIDKNRSAGFRINNKSQTEAEIIIYDEIGESFFGDGVSAKSFSAELKEISSSVKNITVRVNSPGGNVFDGLAIYNRLKQHPAKITVYVDGLAASIASIIALAGDEVIMGEGALFMIHRPSTGVAGNASDLEEMINRLDDVEEQLVGIYMRKTKLGRSEIKTMLADETWMSANEALDFGFVDSTMGAEDVLPIAASSKLPWAKNMPKSKSNFVKSKVSNLTKNIEDFLAR